jgi:uncharacterized membrane protein YebE (DUF533 family)
MQWEMTEKTPLGRDVYIALAAVGWADGQLDPDEADAIVRAAVEEGLELEAINDIEAATKTPVDLGVIDRKGLSKEDRLYVYGIAVWITRMDGVVSDAERAALTKLADALKVPEHPRTVVDRIVESVAQQSGDTRPARYDLAALRSIIAERVASAEAKRNQG